VPVSTSTRTAQPVEEHYELRVAVGDGYIMDREMQAHYVHKVGEDATASAEHFIGDSKEIILVFRDGQQRLVLSDSGTVAPNFNPRQPLEHHFGEMDGLTKGMTMIRTEIVDRGFHR